MNKLHFLDGILFNAASNMRLKSFPDKALLSIILRHFPNVIAICTGDDQAG